MGIEKQIVLTITKLVLKTSIFIFVELRIRFLNMYNKAKIS